MARPPRIVIGVTAAQSLRLLQDLPEALAGQGWDVHVVAGETAKSSFAPPVVLHHVPMVRNPAPWADLAGLVAWVRLIVRLRPDVVLVGTPKAGLLGTAAAWLCRVPVRIYHLRGLRHETARGAERLLLKTLERLTMLLATRVLAVSRSLAALVVSQDLGRRSKTDVLLEGSSNGVDVTRFTPPDDEVDVAAARDLLGLAEDGPVVGFVGRLNESKGLPDLTWAVGDIAAAGERVTLVVVGAEEVSGMREELSAALTASGASFLFTGGMLVDRRTFHAMDVLCLPSYREGFPNVVIEAAACGVPSITTTATGCVDSVVDGHSGWIYPTGDRQALRGLLQRVLSDPASTRAAGRRARLTVERQFSRPALHAAMASYLTEHLVDRGGPRPDSGARDKSGRAS